MASIESLKIQLWHSYYFTAEQWLSDLEFYKNEIKFLRSTVNKYFYWLSDKKKIGTTVTIIKSLSDLENEHSQIVHLVKRHLAKTSDIIENPYIYNMIILKEEHSSIEKRVNGFLNKFQQLRRNEFKLVEDIVPREKLFRKAINIL